MAVGSLEGKRLLPELILQGCPDGSANGCQQGMRWTFFVLVERVQEAIELYLEVGGDAACELAFLVFNAYFFDV